MPFDHDEPRPPGVMSARLVRPRGLNVDGIFGQLVLVAWTELGAVHPADLDELPGGCQPAVWLLALAPDDHLERDLGKRTWTTLP